MPESFMTFLMAQILRLVCLSLDGAVALREKKCNTFDSVSLLLLTDEFSKTEAEDLILFFFTLKR